MASGLIETYKLDNRKEYLPYFDIVSDYMLNKEHKLADGTLARLYHYYKIVWLDDLYMSVPFFSKNG